MPRLISAALLALTLLAAGSPAFGQGGEPAHRLDPAIPSTLAPVGPIAAIDDAGNGIVAWEYQFADPGRLYVARFDVTTGWGPRTAIDTGPAQDRVSLTQLAVSGDGRALLAWTGRRGVYAAAFVPAQGWQPTATVTAGTTPFLTYADQVELAIDGTGRGLVVWSENGAEIFASTYVPGTGWSPPMVVATRGAFGARPFTLASSRGGNAVLLWDQKPQLSDQHTLFAASYLAGAGWQPPTPLRTADFARTPSVAMSDDGGAMAVWVDDTSAADVPIVAARFVPGVGWTAPEVVDDNGRPTDPTVAMDGDGNAVVGWSLAGAVLVNRYDGDLGWQGTETLAAPPFSFTVLSPRLALDGGGNALALWQSSSHQAFLTSRFRPGSGWRQLQAHGTPVRGVTTGQPALNRAGAAVVAWADGYQEFDGNTFQSFSDLHATRFSLTATLPALTVTFSPGTASGFLISNPPGLGCYETCVLEHAGGSVVLQVIEDPGSRFLGWVGEGCSGSGLCVLAMNANRSVSVAFAWLYEIGVQKAGPGGGLVTSSPPGIDCGVFCTAAFTEGTTVTLTATPGPGSVFVGWGDPCSGTGSCTVGADAHRFITATFTRTTLPDLAVTAVTSPPTAGGGRTFTVTSTVRNIGTAEAGPFTVGVYLIPFFDEDPPVIDPLFHQRVATRNVPRLGPGGVSTASTTATLSYYVHGGRYRIGVLADPDDEVAERDESNNQMFSVTLFAIGPEPTGFTPASGPTGTVVTITGRNLHMVTEVRFGGDASTDPPQIVNPTTIRVVTPYLGVTGPITVGTRTGTSASIGRFRFVPKINSFSAAEARVGDLVVIEGTQLMVGDTLPVVKMGSVPLTVLIGSSPLQVLVIVPAAAVTGRVTLTTVDGTTTSPGVLAVIGHPVLTGLTPAVAPVGRDVTLTGTHLASVTAVTFAGAVTVPPTAVLSPAQIRVRVPPGAVTGAVHVTNPMGGATGPILKVPPTLAAFAPARGLPGETVTIDGFNLLSGPAPPVVKIGAATVPVLPGATPLRVQFTVPSTAVSGAITVTTVDGTASSAGPFTVIRLPRLNSLAPARGPVGTAVTLTGTSLSSVGAIAFSGASPVTPTAAIGDTRLVVVVPDDATTGVVSVQNPGGTALGPVRFTVTPRIDALDPPAALPGATLTVTGKSFTGTTVVRIGAVAAPFTATSTTELTVTVPPTAFTGKVSVTTAGGTAISATTFTVIRPPTVTSFSPAAAAVGAQVTIAGAHLGSVTAVTFNGVAAAPPVVLSASQLRVVLPAGATRGRIAVTSVAGNASSATDFVVTPAITSLDPGVALPGASVSIAGTTFTGATAVKFAGVASTFAVLSPTEITATVPATAMTGRITVTTAAGTATSAATFTVIRPPTVTSFSPAAAPVGGQVTLTGANLPSVTAVTFNGVAAVSPVVLSPSQLRVIVPAGATRGRIAVTSVAGNASTSADFVVTPAITAVDPSAALPGTFVTITGTTFTGATVVKFAGVASAFTLLSSTEITALVPANAAVGRITVTTPAGTATSPARFTVIGLPTVTSFSPAGGPVGAEVTLTGTNLGTVTEVTFAAVPADGFTILSPTQLRATVPTDVFTASIGVTNPAGSAQTAALFRLRPLITELSSTSGPVGGVLVISGTNLQTLDGALPVVRFGSLPAEVLTATTGFIVVGVPPQTGRISVTTRDGTATSTEVFTVVNQ